MPGNICVYLEDFSGEGLKLNDLFGFFHCKVITNNWYLGLLPIRTEYGRMINPNGGENILVEYVDSLYD